MNKQNKLNVIARSLIKKAQNATEKAFPLSAKREDWEYLGYVGAAIETQSGNVFTGINLALLCGIGFCAEHSTAAMIQAGETQLKRMVAVAHDGKVLPPCGRCRELIYQLNKKNLDAEVILDEAERSVLLQTLLPETWQKRIRV
ncbi:cytidine deaminase [Lewinella sp. W8]|uniref:cytidine deaminase family protein n=1 Tax=Lewinella sp. W8 TaxID=2528208 RepID=UPI0010673954|nr:cytidine deaminase [Lewinella sp. W8]MTB53443.1 cytidine deaminase [Lewinella sp. W8]